MSQSNIEWTDVTDNIIVVEGGGWWCRKISEGCAHCFAAEINQNSFFGGNKLPYLGTPPKLELRRDVLAGWARQRAPKKHFVASMTDVFGDWVPEEWSFEMLDCMRAAPLQTFQLLTKRADVMCDRVQRWLSGQKMPQNIWLGFSAENQKCFDQRWQSMSNMVACDAVIFVSAEPLLGGIVLPMSFIERGQKAQVICGGESGRHARPMNPKWARLLREQCSAYRNPFFFKQWGEYLPLDHCPGAGVKLNVVDALNMNSMGGGFVRVGKKRGGRLLDGREWNEFPLLPK